MNPKVFDIEGWFARYCLQVGLDTKRCPPDQLRETRRAFWAGVATTLKCMQEDVCQLSEGSAFDALQDMFLKCERFWSNEARLHEEQNNHGRYDPDKTSVS